MQRYLLGRECLSLDLLGGNDFVGHNFILYLTTDIADASSEHQPLMVNGGPELYSHQPTLNIQGTGNNNELQPPSSRDHTPVRVEVNR